MNHYASSRLLRIGFAVILGGLAVCGGSQSAAIAAETIVMKYGPIKRSLPIQDLRELSDTGKASRKLKGYLRLAKQSPEALRSRLNQPVSVSVVTLDSRLNSLGGRLLLDEAGRYIHPPGQQGSTQALRSALVLSAADDNQITLVESLENYPTQDVEVDVEKSVALYRKIDGVINQTPTVSPVIDFLQRRIRSILK
jgi:hypothetical protein